MFKKLTSFLVAMLALASYSNAQTLQEGQIQAFLVTGDVTLTNDATGESQPLGPGMLFGQGYTVATSAGSEATIVVSNGSHVTIKPDSSLSITQLLQMPYDQSLGKFTELQADPSQSSSIFYLNYGEVVGKVKKLQADSDFFVHTATGTAEIKGTTFSVSYDSEKGRTIITNLDGIVIAIAEGNPLDLPAGDTFLIEGSLNPVNNTLEVASTSVRPATPQEVAKAQIAEAIEELLQDAGVPADVAEQVGQALGLTPETEVDTSIVVSPM